MQISDITGHKYSTLKYREDDTFVLPRCPVGVEVEAENVNSRRVAETPLYSGNGGWWDITNDGSLRNSGVEFVSHSPLFGEDLKDSIVSLCEYGKANKFDMNERTSIHIHLDVRDMNQSNLFNLITYYLIFEKALYRFTGNRDSNIFCLPFYGADFALYRLFNIVTATRRNDFYRVLEEFSKYSGMNISSVLQRGSVEFRHLEGTLDAQRIINWINIIMSIKRASMDEKIDVLSLPYRFSLNGASALATEVFGKYGDALVSYKEADKEMLEGVRIAQDAIYGNMYEKWIKKHKPTRYTGVAPRYAQYLGNQGIEKDGILGLPYNKEKSLARLNLQAEEFVEEEELDYYVDEDEEPEEDFL